MSLVVGHSLFKIIIINSICFFIFGGHVDLSSIQKVRSLSEHSLVQMIPSKVDLSL